MLKKIISLIGAVILTITSLNTVFAENQTVIKINGKEIQSETSLIIENGEILVPFRTVAEEMGFYIDWDYISKIAKISTDDKKFTILVWLDSNTANYGYVELILGDTEENSIRKFINNDVSARIIDGRIFIPIYSVAEVLGAEVKRDENFRVIEINKIIENSDLYEKELKRVTEEYEKTKEEKKEKKREEIISAINIGELKEVYDELLKIAYIIDNSYDKLSEKAIENLNNIIKEMNKEFEEYILENEITQEVVDKTRELMKKWLQRLKIFVDENNINI